MKNLLTILLLTVCLSAAHPVAAQIAAIDTVFAFEAGAGTDFGQGAEYFPLNVFGMPSAAARPDVPAATPEEVVSLGLEGVIIVGNTSRAIADRPGPDFVIFENAFEFGFNRIYAEPGQVSVSQFGEEWHDFPCDAASLAGCAGTVPSTGDYEPFDAQRAGGNAFDLADLGLEWARYIRIRDVSRAVRDNSDHAFHDPTINGFELDAVVIINPVDLTTDVGAGAEDVNQSPAISQRGDVVEVTGLRGAAQLEVYSLEGKVLQRADVKHNGPVSGVQLRRGVQAIVLRDGGGVLSRKLVLVE